MNLSVENPYHRILVKAYGIDSPKLSVYVYCRIVRQIKVIHIVEFVCYLYYAAYRRGLGIYYPYGGLPAAYKLGCCIHTQRFEYIACKNHLRRAVGLQPSDINRILLYGYYRIRHHLQQIHVVAAVPHLDCILPGVIVYKGSVNFLQFRCMEQYCPVLSVNCVFYYITLSYQGFIANFIILYHCNRFLVCGASCAGFLHVNADNFRIRCFYVYDCGICIRHCPDIP
ncbi:MAG: hypothetical protein BWY95_02822 [Bacteroidetes bacterium ADurb.BinA104]|nr:MAG: hypothetical protein BWY95_02822 [Bacteroidetes bacterium ADurb.BinA104]